MMNEFREGAKGDGCLGNLRPEDRALMAQRRRELIEGVPVEKSMSEEELLELRLKTRGESLR